jgi:hypothetical protein
MTQTVFWLLVLSLCVPASTQCNPEQVKAANGLADHLSTCRTYAAGGQLAGWCKYDSVCTKCCFSCAADADCGISPCLCPTCATGKYLAAINEFTKKECVDCIAGKYSSHEGATTADTCISCAAGTYSSAGQSTCISCAAGTYSSAGQSTCISCAAGTSSAATGAASNSTCVACAAGTSSAATGAASNSTCGACAAGTHSSAGQSACSACAAGKYVSSEMVVSSEIVTYENYEYRTLAGTWPSWTNTSCQGDWLKIPAGWMLAPSTAQEVTVAYPWGTCCMVLGSYGDSIKSSNSNSNCALNLNCGSRILYKSGGNDYKVAACPSQILIRRQSEDSAQSGATACQDCAAGTYSSHEGATTADTCISCAAGTYSSAGQSTCISCAAGTYSSAGQSTCFACAAGEYVAAGASVCTICAADTYATTNGAACDNCAAGKYARLTLVVASAPIALNALNAMAGADEWKLGDSGQSCDIACRSAGLECLAPNATQQPSLQDSRALFDYFGLADYELDSNTDQRVPMCNTGARVCVYGDVNSVCNTGLTHWRRLCACHSQPPTSQRASACQDCVAGKYLATEGNDAATDCLPCAKGKYSSAPGVSVCVDCTSGKYSATEGNTNESSCVQQPTTSSTTPQPGTSFTPPPAAGNTGSVSAGIVVVTPETLEVQMKVELPYTKDSFDADAQTRFLSAVASSVATPVGNLYIRSVVERTSSRRVLRKLLAVSVEVDFAIRVPDAAAQAAMIANEGLTAGRLNAELAKQVSPFLCTRHAWSACSEFHCAARAARAG